MNLFVFVVAAFLFPLDIVSEGLLLGLVRVVCAVLGVTLLSAILTLPFRFAGVRDVDYRATRTALGYAFAGRLLILPFWLMVLPLKFVELEHPWWGIAGLFHLCVFWLDALYVNVMNILALRAVYRKSRRAVSVGYLLLFVPIYLFIASEASTLEVVTEYFQSLSR